MKKPKQVREEPNPPTADQVEQVLAAIGSKWRLLFVTIEQGALRLGEAVSLRWQDVDAANLRLRLPRSATKRDKARWVYLPEWLIDAIEQTARSRIAYRTAGVPRYHPSVRVPGDFARLQGSASGAFLAARSSAPPHHHLAPVRGAGTRARRASRSRAASMSLDVYSHVIVADEARPSGFWR